MDARLGSGKRDCSRRPDTDGCVRCLEQPVDEWSSEGRIRPGIIASECLPDGFRHTRRVSKRQSTSVGEGHHPGVEVTGSVLPSAKLAGAGCEPGADARRVSAGAARLPIAGRRPETPTSRRKDRRIAGRVWPQASARRRRRPWQDTPASDSAASRQATARRREIPSR